MELKRSIELFIIKDGTHLLMSKRGPMKHGAGKFAVPGGHIDWNTQLDRWETYAECAVREATEELGAQLGEAVAIAFQTDKVSVGAVVDDVRPSASPPVHYLHIALIIDIPGDIEPDYAALDAHEHVDLGWHLIQEVGTLTKSQLYPPHFQQICAFLNGDHRYGQVESLQ